MTDRKIEYRDFTQNKVYRALRALSLKVIGDYIYDFNNGYKVDLRRLAISNKDKLKVFEYMVYYALSHNGFTVSIYADKDVIITYKDEDGNEYILFTRETIPK